MSETEWTLLLVGNNAGIIGEYGDSFSGHPEHYDRVHVVRTDLFEAQAERIAELEARLREEIISGYDDLSPVRKARHANAEAYADAILKDDRE